MVSLPATSSLFPYTTLFRSNDLFVTYFSSTIRWAIAAGKPVLNYDAYGVDLTIYDQSPGVENFKDFAAFRKRARSEEHTSELQSRQYLVCRLLLEKKKVGLNENRIRSRHGRNFQSSQVRGQGTDTHIGDPITVLVENETVLVIILRAVDV